MTPVDGLWRTVRRACSFPSVVARSEAWIAEVWPQARRQGLTKHSTRGIPAPDVIVDDTINFWKVADYYKGVIRICSSEAMGIRLSRFFEWGSPTLNDPPPSKLDYLRASILHELQHAFDYVDRRDIYRHDRYFWRRLTKLEVRFDPRGIA